MDAGDISIILAIVGIGFAIIGIGLTIISMLGNNKLNKLGTRVDSKFYKLSTQIEGVEIKLNGELSRINSQIEGVEIKLNGELSQINSQIALLREQNASSANRDINDKLGKLEDSIRSLHTYN